jgi:hypothetical protein
MFSPAFLLVKRVYRIYNESRENDNMYSCGQGSSCCSGPTERKENPWKEK